MKNKGYFRNFIATIFILLISFSFNFNVKADEYNEEEASNTETKEEIEVTTEVPKEEIKDDKNTQTKDEPLNVATVVKISIIVLLGTVVVYFLSKNEKDEEEVK